MKLTGSSSSSRPRPNRQRTSAPAPFRYATQACRHRSLCTSTSSRASARSAYHLGRFAARRCPLLPLLPHSANPYSYSCAVQTLAASMQAKRDQIESMRRSFEDKLSIEMVSVCASPFHVGADQHATLDYCDPPHYMHRRAIPCHDRAVGHAPSPPPPPPLPFLPPRCCSSSHGELCLAHRCCSATDNPLRTAQESLAADKTSFETEQARMAKVLDSQKDKVTLDIGGNRFCTGMV